MSHECPYDCGSGCAYVRVMDRGILNGQPDCYSGVEAKALYGQEACQEPSIVGFHRSGDQDCRMICIFDETHRDLSLVAAKFTITTTTCEFACGGMLGPSGPKGRAYWVWVLCPNPEIEYWFCHRYSLGDINAARINFQASCKNHHLLPLGSEDAFQMMDYKVYRESVSKKRVF